MEVPIGEKRFFNYYREDSIRKIAEKFGWDLITAANMKDKFMEFIQAMDMSFSYKPVLLKAIFDFIDENGKIQVCDIVDYFIEFYEDRKERGLVAEKSTSIYQKGGYSKKDVEKNILANPFKRFADMRFLKRCRDIEYIEINSMIFKKLTNDDREQILKICNSKLEEYYSRDSVSL